MKYISKIGLTFIILCLLSLPTSLSARNNPFPTTPIEKPIPVASFRFVPVNSGAALILNCTVMANASALARAQTPNQVLNISLNHIVKCTDSGGRSIYSLNGGINSIQHTINNFSRNYPGFVTLLDMPSCEPNWWLYTLPSLNKAMCVYNPNSNANNFPTLISGNGFTGPTAQPANIGNPSLPGYDAKAIGRWDVVPFQMISGRFNIGVVAFHINGIDRVEFSLNNGPWAASTEMKLNPQTDVYEYVVTIDTAVINTANIEVRARIVPRTAGIVRVLQGAIANGIEYTNGNHSLFLTKDTGQNKPIVYCAENGRDDNTATGTESNPFRQPAYAAKRISDSNGSTDFGTIYLKPGYYSFGPRPAGTTRSNGQGWLTISAAPGIAADQVFIDRSATGGLGPKNIRLMNLTILKTDYNNGPRLAQDSNSFLWFDHARVIGIRTQDYTVVTGSWWAGIYATDTFVTNSRNGLRSSNFMRNVSYDVSSGSPFGQSGFVVNGRVNKYDNSGTEFHGDVFHWYYTDDTHENIIVYGVHAPDFKTQALFAEEMNGMKKMDNVAIVNFHAALLEPTAAGSWWERDTNHLLLWHVSLPDQPMRWKLAAYGSTLRNVSIKNSIFKGFSYDDITALPNVTITNNHFTASDPVGQNATAGAIYQAINENGFIGYDGPVGNLVRNNGIALPSFSHPADGSRFSGQTRPNRGAIMLGNPCSNNTQALVATKGKTVFSSFDLQLYGSSSIGCNAPINSYRWSFSDNSTINTANAVKSFDATQTGQQNIRLTVNNGISTSASQTTITVLPLPEPRMLSYHKFNDTANDETLRHVDGAWTPTSTPSYGVGRDGTAARFSANNLISIPADNMMGIDRMTVGVWAKRSASNSNGYVLYRHPEVLMLELATNRINAKLKTTVNGATVDRIASYTMPSDDQWHHYALRYDGRNLALFVDGVKRSETTGTAQGVVMNYGTWPLNVGARSGNASLNGLVDELKIYHKALSDDEVQAQYQLLRP